MVPIRAKKYLGQHFLKDETIARKIVDSLSGSGYSKVLEIGAGTGVLTKFLLHRNTFELFVSEVDIESIDILLHKFPELKGKIYGDFLEMNVNNNAPFAKEPTGIIGNFPYNISSQILFRVLEYRKNIPEVVGMFQKEVAERIASKPNSKKYGILSVLLQAFYDIEYLFTVNENVFVPVPKVKSAVVRLIRNQTEKLECDEVLFKAIVKTAFNQRRKTLRNSLKKYFSTLTPEIVQNLSGFMHKRAEQLTVGDFVEMSKLLEIGHFTGVNVSY